MPLYTIADLHLSTLSSTNKSMEVFGTRWDHYIERIESNWRRLITDRDTVVIPGDVSWALTMEEALSDLKFLDSLPGKKILGKGNHDFWWSTLKKAQDFFGQNEIRSISFLHNNAVEVEDFILAGTRGWFMDEDATAIPKNTDFEKISRREELRLGISLEAAAKLREASPDKEILVFLHFPPYYQGKTADGLLGLLDRYGVRRVYYGHIHGNYALPPFEDALGKRFTLVAADYLAFLPKIIVKNEDGISENRANEEKTSPNA